jgi:CubicO group peptidase (beta-lactamase class C family)
MKFHFLILLICLVNELTGQKESIVRLDGSRISFAEADSIVRSLVDTADIHGLCLSVLNNNKAVFIKSYGYRNQPANQMLDTASIMYGASFSKAVFGYLVVKLVEENLLDLDKPLYQYLPKPIGDYEYFSDLKNDERCNVITARMCLNHTTGLPNIRWFNPVTNEEDTLGVLKIYCTPGTKYAYSGEGFKLLQLVIEGLSNRTIDDLATEKIFKPAGMNRTGYVWHSSFGDENTAVGHLNNGLIDIKKKRSTGVAGGSLVTTIADYTRFIEWVMQKKGLKTKSFDQMVNPDIEIFSKTQFPPVTFETTDENRDVGLAYGLGWGVLKCPYGRAFFKEGNGESWRNYNINYIDKGMSIIILINSENGEKIFQELLEKLLADNCIPWEWEGYVSYKNEK